MLRAAYRQAHPTAASPHVSGVQWEQLTCGELSPSERDHLLTHIFSCPPCQQVHRSLLQVRAEAPAFDRLADGDAVATPVARKWMYLGTLAAAAVIAAAVFVDLRPLRSRPDDVVRTGAARATLTLLVPAADQVLSNRQLSWQPVDGADEYEVRVSAADGGAVWTARVPSSAASIPQQVAMPAGRYYWQVTAIRDGAAAGASPMARFRVE